MNNHMEDYLMHTCAFKLKKRDMIDLIANLREQIKWMQYRDAVREERMEAMRHDLKLIKENIAFKSRYKNVGDLV